MLDRFHALIHSFCLLSILSKRNCKITAFIAMVRILQMMFKMKWCLKKGTTYPIVSPLTSPHWWNIRPAALCKMMFLLYPEGCPLLFNNPICLNPGRLSFIQFGQSPRLQRLTKRAHSRRRAARATTGAS